MEIEGEKQLKAEDKPEEKPEDSEQEKNESTQQEKTELAQSDLAKTEAKSEFISSQEPKIEPTNSEAKMEVYVVEEEEKKADPTEANENQNQEKVKALFTRESDNFFYFFKLPLLMINFYEGLEARAPIEELQALKHYLDEIYVVLFSSSF